MSELYKKTKFYSAMAHESNDCAVIAVSIATDTHYDLARDALKKFGREDGRGTEEQTIIDALDYLGYRLDIVERNFTRMEQNLRRAKRVVKDYQDGVYCLIYEKHIAAIRNGILCDWNKQDTRPVHKVWKITKKG